MNIIRILVYNAYRITWQLQKTWRITWTTFDEHSQPPRLSLYQTWSESLLMGPNKKRQMLVKCCGFQPGGQLYYVYFNLSNNRNICTCACAVLTIWIHFSSDLASSSLELMHSLITVLVFSILMSDPNCT